MADGRSGSKGGMARRPMSLQDLLAATTAVSVTFGAATSVEAVHGGHPDWIRGFAAILLIVLMPCGVFTAVFFLTHGWRRRLVAGPEGHIGGAGVCDCPQRLGLADERHRRLSAFGVRRRSPPRGSQSAVVSACRYGLWASLARRSPGFAYSFRPPPALRALFVLPRSGYDYVPPGRPAGRQIPDGVTVALGILAPSV